MSAMLSRRRALACGLGAACHLLLPGAVAGNASRSVSPRKMQVWGYYPVWMQDTWRQLNLPLWDRAILFELPITADGAIDMPPNWYEEWRAMARAFEVSGAGFDLGLTLLDEGRFNLLFSRAEARHQLLTQILAVAALPGVTGIHLDFEVYKSMPDAAVSGYRDFMARLGRELQRPALPRRPVLSVFFPVGGERDLLDGKAIANVDFVVVQGYDAHWAESETAGPVAPLKGEHKLSWENTLRHVLNVGVPRRKILFSVPYFGYEWPVESDQPRAPVTGTGATTTYAPVDAGLLPWIRISVTDRLARYPVKRDPSTGSPFYTYQTPDGKWYQGWFEDRASLAEKFDFVVRENLCGIAVFPLGYDAGSFDSLIAEKFGVREKAGK
jgi:spore germination protein YaaH